MARLGKNEIDRISNKMFMILVRMEHASEKERNATEESEKVVHREKQITLNGKYMMLEQVLEILGYVAKPTYDVHGYVVDVEIIRSR